MGMGVPLVGKYMTARNNVSIDREKGAKKGINSGRE